jgi:hypothetical protein
MVPAVAVMQIPASGKPNNSPNLIFLMHVEFFVSCCSDCSFLVVFGNQKIRGKSRWLMAAVVVIVGNRSELRSVIGG